MPLFIIEGFDVANSSALRATTRQAHLARLSELVHQNRLLLAGPTPIAHGEPQMSGSVIIAQFDSLKDAQAWVNEEPYLISGIYASISVRPFVQVLP